MEGGIATLAASSGYWWTRPAHRSAPSARAGAHHIKRLDDCFGDFLVRVVCECGACREIQPQEDRLQPAGLI